MKIKEIKELRAKDIKDLEALVIKKRQELLKLNVKLLAGKEKYEKRYSTAFNFKIRKGGN